MHHSNELISEGVYRNLKVLHFKKKCHQPQLIVIEINF